MAARESRTIFIRQSFIKRGAIPNTWSFTRVKRIEVLQTGLTIEVKALFRAIEIHNLDWNEITRIEVTEKDAWKSAGGGAGGYYKLRLCKIVSTKGSFVIDVSTSFSDFPETRKFLNALKEYVEVIEPPKQSKSRKKS